MSHDLRRMGVAGARERRQCAGVNAADPLLPNEPAPSQSLSFVKSILAVGCVFGILMLMAGSRIEARAPQSTELQPPIVPQGAVFVGGVGEGKSPVLAGHAVAVRAGGRDLALTARTVFGPSTEEGEPEVVFRLFDPDQQAVVKAGARVAFGICRPDGTPHVPEDYAVFELPASELTGPLEVQEQPPSLGEPLWIAAHTKEGLELTLVEVAEVAPQELTLFMAKGSVVGWAGAPCLNAKGEVVATVSRVIEGQDAFLVQAVLVKEAIKALGQ